MSRAFKELCLLSGFFPHTNPPAHLAVPCATRAGLVRPTASCGLFREVVVAIGVESGQSASASKLSHFPSSSAGGISTVSVSVERSKPVPVLPPRGHRLTGDTSVVSVRFIADHPLVTQARLSRRRARRATRETETSADDHPTLEVGPAGMAADGDDASTGKAESAARQPISDVPTATGPDPTARAIATPRTVAPGGNRGTAASSTVARNPSPESPRDRPLSDPPPSRFPTDASPTATAPESSRRKPGRTPPPRPRRSLPLLRVPLRSHWADRRPRNGQRWSASAPSRVEPRPGTNTIRSVRPGESGGRWVPTVE